MRSKAALTDAVPDRTEKNFTKAGIERLHGTACFASSDEGTIGTNLRVRPERIVIATGSRTASLDFPGAEFTVTSDEFLELEQLPQRVVFIGGGYIAMEFAHVARADMAQQIPYCRVGNRVW